MLLGEISDYRAQRRNIEEESGESYCIKKDLPPALLPDAGSDSRSLHAQLSGPPAAVNRAWPKQVQTHTRLPFWDSGHLLPFVETF